MKWLNDEKNKELSLGHQRAQILTDDLALEVVEAVKRLKPYGRSVSDAVDFLISHLEATGDGKALGELVDTFIKAKKRDEKSPRYLADLNSRLGRMVKDFGPDVRLATISTERVDDWLQGLGVGPQSRNHYRRTGHAFFQWAVKRRFAPENPFSGIDKAVVKRDLPGIYNKEQMDQLFAKAGDDPELIAWIALGAYAGLRPSEIKRLDWEDIHLKKRVIDLSGSATKGGRRRLVKILDTLASKLEPIDKSSGEIVGEYFDSSKQLRDLKEAVGFDWPHDVLRHSFGTYHLAAFEDAGKTSLQMGHSGNPSMLFNHYHRPGIDKATALDWWGISNNR
jgi:integrase